MTALAELLRDALGTEKHGFPELSSQYVKQKTNGKVHKSLNTMLCCCTIGGLNALGVLEGIDGVPFGFDTLQCRKVRLPVLLLWHTGYVQVHISWICPSDGGIGEHRGQFVMEVGQEGSGGVGKTDQVDPVGLIEHQLVTMSVSRGVRGNICDSTACHR